MNCAISSARICARTSSVSPSPGGPMRMHRRLRSRCRTTAIRRAGAPSTTAPSWRLHEDDFGARSHTIARYGASAIPEHSSLADWPLSYADLEPYYDRAEYELG